MAATPKSKAGGDKSQRKLAFSKEGLGLQEPEVKSRYAPPEHFQLVDGAEPLVGEALDSNTELWLVRIPANEISQEDLVEKKLRISVDSADGKVGHFFTLQGQEYNIMKQDSGDVVQPYAAVPTESGQFLLRKIRRQVGLVRNIGVFKDSIAPETPESKEEVLNSDKQTAPAPAPVPVVVKRKRAHEGSQKR
ncbi:hypothetical protein MPTK1_1g27370 [Marchantia polymorpha subsp. ruderalis]|uniref:Uncharacterized protein n=2 Tax=Marchantia polymorpha TaxID=3197 RepID=A0A176W166_MARPO|nr:hypothetical protein AXG93_1712s1140 [Marchantia polymorpha subsp. ruderalis]PTQ49666.1 hypothetical protein MARPO_0002s0141 [Marchantia polymorpha]BBN00218.1 hypothetical protein Mp_1g27370 [Marchantia polymorpha subsp. ruderalis]|eukprot:PTQ49666.1 hypothetical protein MARPO_0002s0141 [Marchantia polymorpha]